MPFSIYRGEKSLNDLVLRLFNLKDPLAKSQLQQARDALLKANPQLRDLTTVSHGSLIVIPDKGLSVRSNQLASGPELVQTFAHQNIHAVFEKFTQRLTEVESNAMIRLKNGIAQLQASKASGGFRELAEQNARFENDGGDSELYLDPVKTLKPILDASLARLQSLDRIRDSLASFNIGAPLQPAEILQTKAKAIKSKAKSTKGKK
jgi:hypothetical protein